MNEFIERDGKYNLEVTGEQLMTIWWYMVNTSSGTKGVTDLYNKLKDIPQCQETKDFLISRSIITYSTHRESAYIELDKLFYKAINIKTKTYWRAARNY